MEIRKTIAFQDINTGYVDFPNNYITEMNIYFLDFTVIKQIGDELV